MQKLTASGPRLVIEAAGALLFDTDPAPVSAVDCREESRQSWRLDAFVAEHDDPDRARLMLAERFPDLDVRLVELPDRDWVAVSLEGLPAVRAGRFVVAGDHALRGLSPGLTTIEIEAGPAFGTGHHGTTKGCLLALDRLLRARTPRKVLDVGTGTGVLAIAALKAGADRALGTDTDADSVVSAAENARKAGVETRARFLTANGTRAAAIRDQGPYDLIFANILAGPLVTLSPQLSGLLGSGGHVVLSGLLNAQAPLVRAAYTGRGLHLVERIRLDGWTSLVFRRPAT